MNWLIIGTISLILAVIVGAVLINSSTTIASEETGCSLIDSGDCPYKGKCNAESNCGKETCGCSLIDSGDCPYNGKCNAESNCGKETCGKTSNQGCGCGK
jgi:hypothetical protein